MSTEENFLKYAHTEGHTFVCYEEKGRYLLTCGGDGYVKIWDGIDDCDPVSKHVAENVLSVAIAESNYYVGSDVNSVLAYSFPKSVPGGMITRFTAQVTDLIASADGKALLIGSGDFSVKYIQLSNNSFKVMLGHEAPVLGVALDPLKEFAASSSCDGTVRVWEIAKQRCVKSWTSVVPKSNDFSTSKVCCKLTWHPQAGKYLAVPVEKSVILYNRDKWDEFKKLTDSTITELINVLCFTKCGTYLAAGCVNGVIVVWNMLTFKVVKRLKHEKELTICSMAWNPNGNGDLVFCDLRGHMCGFKDVLSKQEVIESVEDDENDILENEMLHMDDDDDDENSFSISKIKAQLDLSHLGDPEENLNTAAGTVKSTTPSVVVPQLELQAPFQPGSTPVHYQRRFMKWNSVGIIRSFDTEEETAIEIEFHDSSIHHSIHLENVLSHTMADMSNTAVVLACKSQANSPSQLVCLHFASWDNHKQWNCEMVEDEFIEATAVSDEWIAFVTNLQQVRLFSIGGVQLPVLTLPGPVVAVAAHQDKFLIAYHQGLGLPGNQSLAAMLINVSFKTLKSTLHTLPLSPKSTLFWLGFTDEGNPCAVDSCSIVRIFASSVGDCWMQIANTKLHAKGVSDSHFVVGLSEIQQQIRCIPCKGSKYPPTLPHPTLIILPFQLPLCGLSTQFSQIEENYRRASILSETFQELDKQGYETDASHVQRTEQLQKELLMKLFALACRNDHEFRAVELAKMMDSYHTVQLAIRYTTQLKHFHLADKLGEIAIEKLEEETANENNVEEDTGEEEVATYNNNAETSTNNHTQDAPSPTQEEASQELFEQIPSPPKSIPVLSNETRFNPFKVNTTPTDKRGIQVLDEIKLNGNTNKKPTVKNNNTPKVTKQTNLLLNFTSNKKIEPKSKTSDKASTSRAVNISKKVQLWMEENMERLKEKYPEADDKQLASFAEEEFKQLPADVQSKWKRDNKKSDKRKLNSSNDKPSKVSKKSESDSAPQRKSSLDKLKAFSFQN